MAYTPPLNGGRINATISGNTAGAGALVSTGTMTLAGGNNITLSQAGNAITISGNAGGAGLSAGTQSVNTGTVNFANSNGVSFGMSGSNQITATVATTYAASNHSHGNPTLNLTNLSGTTASASNGLTLSLSAAAPGGGAGLSAGTQSVNTGTVNFANSNGITFGMSGSSQVTASHNGITSQTAQTVGLYATGANTTGQSSSNTFDARSFSISAQGGLYAGMSGNTLQLSAATQSVQTQSRFNLSVGGNSTSAGAGYAQISSGTMLLAGGNNITLSQNGNSVSIVGGAGGAGGGIAMAGSEATTYTSGTVNLVGDGAVTIYTATNGANQSLRVSIPGTSSLSATGAFSISTNGATISMGAPAFSAGMSNGGNTSGTTGTVSNQLIFAGGNNITLSQSTGAGGNTLNIIGGGGGGAGLSAGTQSVSTGTVNFANSNGITFGMSGSSQITASHNALTSQSGQALSASNGSFAFQTAGFSNANGVTFGTSAGSIMTASVNTSYAASNHSHGNPTLALTNLSGTTASASNGLTLSLSAAAPGAGGGVALANSQTTYTSGTANFLEGGGAITIASTTGQKFNFSVPATSSLSATGAVSISTNGGTISIGAPVQSVQTANLYATGNSTQLASTAGVDLRSLSFQGAGNVSVGVSQGKVLISAPSAGGGIALYDGTNSISSGTALISATGALAASVNGQTLSLGAPYFNGIVSTLGSTLGNTGTIASQTQMILAGGQNIALSQGTASGAATVTIHGRKRVVVVTVSATPSINTDNGDLFTITGLSTNITSFTTNLSGTPVNGQTLWIAITDNGTARTLAWGTSFEASTVALPTTTVASARLDIGFVWNTATSKWRCIAVA
jgi:hypothetical protein